MSQKNTQSKSKTAKKVKKRMDTATKLIIAGLVVIAIPFMVLGYILISASMDTGSILAGDRFDGDLDPAITDTQLESIETNIQTNGSVEDVETILKTATLRVYVDVVDSTSIEEVEAIANEAYNNVMSVLNVDTYFTYNNGKSMYDLEVHVYNLNENRDSDEFNYVIVSKSSMNEEKVVDVASVPKDAELAQQIRDDLAAKRNPTESTTEEELTVGGEDDGVIENSEDGE